MQVVVKAEAGLDFPMTLTMADYATQWLRVMERAGWRQYPPQL